MNKKIVIILIVSFLIVVLVGAVIIFSREDQDTGTQTATTPTATTPTATTPTTPPAPGPGETEPEPEPEIPGAPFGLEPQSGGTEDIMVLKEIRFGDHEGYERVVLEFTGQLNNPGTGVPLFQVKEGAMPYFDLNNEQVQIGGTHYIEIVYNGNTHDLSQDDAPKIYMGPTLFTPAFGVMAQATFVPAFEANTLILLVGLGGEAPFRVLELTGPPRIVVDVQKS